MRPTTAALALLLALAPAAVAAAQATAYEDRAGLPDGPVAPVVEALIAAIDADDANAFLRFLDEQATDEFRHVVPDEEHVAIYRQVRGETGGVDLHGYRVYDPPRPDGAHVIIVRDRLGGDWRAFVIRMDDDDPARLSGLRFAPARAPSNVAPEPALDEAGIVAALDDHVDRLVAADAFSGSVLLARHGRVLLERAAGRASLRYDVPNRVDTKFNLGSMNKMFTAVVIGRLVQDGAMTLDDPIDRWIDESWLPASITGRIQVRHLLSHTSGLGSYFTEAFMNASRARFRTIDDYKEIVREETLQFDPGTQWSYSNTGFLLLGAIIEAVTGRPYDDVVRECVHDPAGMPDTRCYEMDRPVPNLAIGYDPVYEADGTRTWRNNLFMHVVKGGPAGGGFSTVHDLLAFDAALREGRLVADAVRDELWRPHPELASPDYGFGFTVQRTSVGRVVGHSGGFPGINSRLDMYLDSGWTVVVMSNRSGGASGLANKAGTLIAREARD